MHKFYKHKLYRKYHDEIWGQIASSRKFSYNKKLILIKFREIVVKRRLRVKTKFKYFRRGFLKHLKNTAFAFKRSRKLLRTTLFVEKKKFRPRKSSRKSFRFGKSLFLLKLSLGLLLSKVQRTNNPRIIKQGILFFCKKKKLSFSPG
jgi:hypothetical protein